MIVLNYIQASNKYKYIGNLLVNWPKLLGPFQNSITVFFDVYVFGMSFYITSSTNK